VPGWRAGWPHTRPFEASLDGVTVVCPLDSLPSSQLLVATRRGNPPRPPCSTSLEVDSPLRPRGTLQHHWRRVHQWGDTARGEGGEEEGARLVPCVGVGVVRAVDGGGRIWYRC